MKKIFSVIIPILITAMLFSGCSEKNTAKTELLQGKKLSKYITLGDYQNITADTSDEAYLAYYNAIIESDVSSGGFYNEITTGTVQDGYIANIDYVGRLNGVAFSGGTASDYDLTIGSGKFIEGFEDGLIGVNIGDTVELELTFPVYYGNTELAGKDVVFTVTVNYAKCPQNPEEYYEKLSYKSLDDYIDNVNMRSFKNYIFSMAVEESTVKENPVDRGFRNVIIIGYKDNEYLNSYGVDFAQYQELNGSTINKYISDVPESLDIDYLASDFTANALIKRILTSYAIITEQDLSIDASALSDYTGAERLYRESCLVQETAAQYLYELYTQK